MQDVGKPFMYQMCLLGMNSNCIQAHKFCQMLWLLAFN